MKKYKKQFLGDDIDHPSFQNAPVIILPFGYEGGVSYGKGTSKAPDSIIDASYYLELYDEVLDIEPYTVGILTIEPPVIPTDPEKMVQTMYDTTKKILAEDKFIVSVGGDHSISTGYCKALLEKYGNLSVIQIDAHADLRHSYAGSIYSHASVMSRIRELTTDTLQIGIRSLSKEEAQMIKDENLLFCTMNDFRNGNFDIDAALKNLPDPVIITFDVDALDWSVVSSTGTPEPGGLLWDETLNLLTRIFSAKNVIGFDLVELSHNEYDPNSAFAVAKLIYKMIGYKYYL
ncbi:agmatinase [Calditrichota bacterium]